MSLAPFFTRQQRHGGGRQALSPRYREMDDVNRQFGDLIRVFFGDPTGFIGAAVTPPVDIEETDDAYVVDQTTLHHKNPLTPYHGKTLSGVVRKTFVRGTPVDFTTPHGRQISRGID